MADPVHVRVQKWLEQSLEKSEKMVDHGWKVDISPENEMFMVIDSEKMPFKIIVSVETEMTYIAFVTGLKLTGQSNEVLAPIFRDLLIQNNSMQLSKFCLMGEDDTLCLRTDLYTNYMNKKEFNIALESVVMGGRWLIAQLGQTEDENIRAKEMAALGSAELLKGTSKGEVVAKMIKAGFEEVQAKDLVGRLMADLGIEDTDDAQPSKISEQTRRDNPVDRYIW